jgi:hypothetical protein
MGGSLSKRMLTNKLKERGQPAFLTASLWQCSVGFALNAFQSQSSARLKLVLGGEGGFAPALCENCYDVSNR